MQLTESNKVHLDHLIERLSIRYYQEQIDNQDDIGNPVNRINDQYIRFNDIRGEWFERLKKPDFQRETNAWSPKQCKDFIESVFLGQIIPSIILWKSQENGVTYILDGAHRLSVIRAWMTDDWGDDSDGYYERRDLRQIHEIAKATRLLVNTEIGSFNDFKDAHNELQRLIKEGEAPKKKMDPKKFLQASFYADVIGSNSSLYAQYETGNYESAEQSFLRINRQGQALDPWESTLIEFRKGSYSRSIMHIANCGETGHYWPKQSLSDSDLSAVETFSEYSKNIYTKLFVPPFLLPIKDLTVPILVAPAYFQKHLYLLEIIPLLVLNDIAADANDQIKYLQRDVNSDSSVVVKNANEILSTMNSRLEHLVSNKNNPLSLSLVPLMYWYNHRGQFLRSILYGFLHWLFNGSTKEIHTRKIIFSGNREKIEYLLFFYKQEIAAMAAKSGAGLKAVKVVSNFFEGLVSFLTSNSNIDIDDEKVMIMMQSLTKQKKATKSIKRSGRTYTKRDKSQSNINELFDSSIRCHICNGIVNLKYGGIQYDHVKEFKISQETDPENMKPTHPFCNNNRKKIEQYRSSEIELNLPKAHRFKKTDSVSNAMQLTIEFWSPEEDFPM
jgi:hypothetical protein